MHLPYFCAVQMKIKYSILFLIVNYIWVVGNLQLHSHAHNVVDIKTNCEHQDHHHADEDTCAVCYFQFTPNSLIDFNTFELAYYPSVFVIDFNKKPVSKTTEKSHAGLFSRGPPKPTA